MDGYKLSVLRLQRGAKNSAATMNPETSSMESGEMPIMKPADVEPAKSPTANSENGVYFKTAIRAGDGPARDRTRISAGARGGGIQKHTTVSVHTEQKRRRDADIV